MLVLFLLVGAASLLAAASAYIIVHRIPVVLMFHAIVEQPRGLDVSPQRLKTFLDSARVSDRALVFTTDSSDRSIYDEFAPRVREHGFSVILFLMPSGIGRNGMLTWDQVRVLDRAGVVVASHTLTHPWLADLSDEELWCEQCASKQMIEAEIGYAVMAMAYPYDAFDERVKRMARQCGYTAAYSTAPGRRVADDDPLAIKRVTIADTTVANPLLRWLVLSGFWVTAREVLLAFVPIEVPRKPQDWSYVQWRKTVKTGDDYRAFCSVSPSAGAH
ncbi:MAG: polysaccharide deacetylase family protein [Nitrospirota bacterium]|nr:polysaccharide deacetylase family protein [Nitrospirota bacterium]